MYQRYVVFIHMFCRLYTIHPSIHSFSNNRVQIVFHKFVVKRSLRASSTCTYNTLPRDYKGFALLITLLLKKSSEQNKKEKEWEGKK